MDAKVKARQRHADTVMLHRILTYSYFDIGVHELNFVNPYTFKY